MKFLIELQNKHESLNDTTDATDEVTQMILQQLLHEKNAENVMIRENQEKMLQTLLLIQQMQMMPTNESYNV
jgi:recombinational DNA repair protein (RecF pathway)